MTVEVSPITIAGSPVVRTFSDTFNRASGLIGTNWLLGNPPFTPAATPAQLQDYTIGVSLLDAAQCLIAGSINGAANPNWVLTGFAIPIPAYMAILSKDQFAQATIVNATGAGVERANGGLAACMSFNPTGGIAGFAFYYLEALPQINVLQFGRCINGSYNFAAPFGGIAGGVANGDVLRLSVDIQSTQCVLTATKNGSVVGTATDSSAQRLTIGVPGIATRGSGGVNPGRTEWRNFSCGIGA